MVEGWVSKSGPGSGSGKKSKNKFKKSGDKLKSGKGGGRNIDAELRGQRQLLERRIAFVPAKRAGNGDTLLAGADNGAASGAGGSKHKHAAQSSKDANAATAREGEAAQGGRDGIMYCIDSMIQGPNCTQSHSEVRHIHTHTYTHTHMHTYTQTHCTSESTWR
jgi:hypothetical protein